MNLRLLSSSALLCLAMMITGARVGSAQQVQPLEPEWLQRMYAEGWQKAQEGVLRRDTGGGRYETFSFGMEGLQWVVEGYERQLAYFQGKYDESPNTDLAELIEQLQGRIDSLYEELAAAPSSESFDGEALEGCSMGYGDPTASAGARQNPQGVWATATANFDTAGCSFEAHTFATAYAHATEGTVETTKTQNDPKSSLATNGYPSIRSTASASADGSTDCEAWAQSELRVPQLGISLQPPPAQWSGCPALLTTSITGSALVTTDYYTSACADVTWGASATGGSPGYTYEWYLGTSTTPQGTGATFTKNYCSTNGTVTAKVVAKDAQNTLDDETFTTTLNYRAPIVASISGPATVSTNTTTPCADVNWTASATSSGGNHSGFTYQWYIGTALQGSGSTLTKRYCSTSKSETVKVVATASDNHTSEATKTTTITHIPTVTASIGGPTDASISTPGGCTFLSWTATATGGSPAYTYKWYVGTSTTIEGTGSTLRKQFCGPQTINVKVVVRDSVAQTANATFTTNLYFDPPECGTGPSCQ